MPSRTPVPDFDQGTQTTPDEPVVIDFEDLSEALRGELIDHHERSDVDAPGTESTCVGANPGAVGTPAESTSRGGVDRRGKRASLGTCAMRPLRTSCGRVTWRCAGFCFPGGPRAAVRRTSQFAECSESRTNAGMSTAVPVRWRGRGRSGAGWRSRGGRKARLGSPASGLLRSRFTASGRRCGPWVDPRKGRRPGGAESGTATHLEKPPIDDLTTEWIAAPCLLPTRRNPHFRAEPP